MWLVVWMLLVCRCGLGHGPRLDHGIAEVLLITGRVRAPAAGSITKSPCGGELSGRSPVDRGKQGTKRSVVTDGRGIPLAPVGAGTNRHDSPL